MGIYGNASHMPTWAVSMWHTVYCLSTVIYCRAEHAVLVGTGIGITPFASILQSISRRYSQVRQLIPGTDSTPRYSKVWHLHSGTLRYSQVRPQLPGNLFTPRNSQIMYGTLRYCVVLTGSVWYSQTLSVLPGTV